MSETTDGVIAYRLRHAQKGRATHRVMTPVDFAVPIAALIPPPRHPLLRYFGVFGPHSSRRKLCVPAVVDSTELTVGLPSHAKDTVAAQIDVAKAEVSPQHQSAGSGFGGAVVDTASQPVDQCEHVASPKLAARTVLNPCRIDWATLLKRTYDCDVLKCSCGGRLKAVELVTDAERGKELP